MEPLQDPALELERWVRFEQDTYNYNPVNSIRIAAEKFYGLKTGLVRIRATPVYLLEFREQLKQQVHRRLMQVYRLNNNSVLCGTDFSVAKLGNVEPLIQIDDFDKMFAKLNTTVQLDDFSPYKSYAVIKKLMSERLECKRVPAADRRQTYCELLGLTSLCGFPVPDTPTIMQAFVEREICDNLAEPCGVFKEQIRQQFVKVMNNYNVSKMPFLMNQEGKVFPSSGFIPFEQCSNILGLLNFFDQQQPEMFLQLYRLYFMRLLEDVGQLLQLVGLVYFMLKSVDCYQFYVDLGFNVTKFVLVQAFSLMKSLRPADRFSVLDMILQYRDINMLGICVAGILHFKARLLKQLACPGGSAGGQYDVGEMVNEMENIDVVKLLQLEFSQAGVFQVGM